LASENVNVGSVGVVGQRFNKKSGFMIRVTDEELEGSGYLSVDNIAGGMCKLVNADVLRKSHILPDSSLFYGFEELDFDLRIKKEGYRLLADKEMYKKHRAYYNRIGIQIKRGNKKEMNALWREYYSIRNSLIILKKNRLYIALLITTIRITIKSIVAFRFGFSYGKKIFKNATIAYIHFCIGKRGAYSVNI
jgi:GT2 family glycosyltransferase